MTLLFDTPVGPTTVLEKQKILKKIYALRPSQYNYSSCAPMYRKYRVSQK